MHPTGATLAFVLLLSNASWLCAAPDVQDLYEKGAQAERDKHLAAAEQAYQDALGAARSAADKRWIARILQSLAGVHEARQQWKEAIAGYTEALSLYEELGLRRELNGVLFRLGIASAAVGRYNQSIEYLNRAKAGLLETNEDERAAQVLDYLGQLQTRIHDFDSAENNLARAIALYRSKNNARGIAKVRGSLANLDWRRSRFRSALESGFAALDEDERYADWREAAKVLDILGGAFLNMGQQENALRYYRRALGLRQKYELKDDLAFSYRNIGACLTLLGSHQEALSYYRKALELGEAVGNPREIADNKLNIGDSELAMTEFDKARQDFEEALKIAEQNGYRQQANQALFGLANIFQGSNQLDRALMFHQRALELSEETRDRQRILRSLDSIGIVLEQRGDLKGALAAHERALGEFEAIAAGIADPVQYGAFRTRSATLYPFYARVLVKLGRPWDALLVAERSRAVGLSRLAALNGASFSDLLGPDNYKLWQRNTTELARADNALRLAEEPISADAEPTGESGRNVELARARFFEAQKQLSGLRDRLFASTPALRAAQNPPPPTVAQLRSLAKGSPDTLFLEWMIVDQSSSLLFAFSGSGLQAFELKHGRAGFLSLSNRWRASLVRVRRGAHSEEPRLAKELYENLCSPLEPLFGSGTFKRLVIVSEGPLLDIPFAALMNPQGERLIDRFAISNTVSLSYLLRSPNRSRPARSLLAVADPLAPGEERLVVPSGYRYEELRDARQESETVRSLYSGSLLLAGPSAQEASVKRLLPQFAILHFATHGILDANDGLQSGLLLATEPADSDENGILQAWEIAEMSLPARLVVLSACDTGLGNERLGDGLLGIAWAFLAAGAPRVVASLWSLDDTAANHLVVEFYREMNRGTRLDDAMRKSMLRLRKDPQYEAPFYWSALQILGQGGAL